MKKSILLTAMGIFLVAFAFAQSEETRSLSAFSEVSARNGVDVYLKKGSKLEARVVADGIELEDIETEVSSGRLKIGVKDMDTRWRKRNNFTVKVYITHGEIDALSASGAASIIAKDALVTDGDFDISVSGAGDIQARLEADELSVKASGAGDAELELDVNEIEAEISGASDVEVSGTSKFLNIRVSGAGEYDGYDLTAEEARVICSGAGTGKVNVSNKIYAKASGGSTVRYKGSPKYVDVSSNSGGSVKKY